MALVAYALNVPVDPTVQINIDFFEQRFKEGYGIKYPETHVIRFYNFVLSHQLKIKSGNLLDFGCALGAHSRYFEDHGFTAFGCDSSETAIAKFRLLSPSMVDRTVVTPPMPDLVKTFPMQFDVVFANQVLAYFPNQDINLLVSQFHRILKPGGVLFASMYPRSNGIVECVTGHKGPEHEMSEITLEGRLKGLEYVNFKEESDLAQLFRPFDALHTGLASIRFGDYGGNDQVLYAGRKV